MYDSLNSDNYLKSAKPLLSKIAYQLEIKGRIEVFTVNMQLQDGGIDCGLFAIACAFELCQNNDPATKQFKQSEMRSHLQSCFNNDKMTSFPHEPRQETIVQTLHRFNKC